MGDLSSEQGMWAMRELARRAELDVGVVRALHEQLLRNSEHVLEGIRRSHDFVAPEMEQFARQVKEFQSTLAPEFEQLRIQAETLRRAQRNAFVHAEDNAAPKASRQYLREVLSRSQVRRPFSGVFRTLLAERGNTRDKTRSRFSPPRCPLLWLCWFGSRETRELFQLSADDIKRTSREMNRAGHNRGTILAMVWWQSCRCLVPCVLDGVHDFLQKWIPMYRLVSGMAREWADPGD